MNVVQASFPSWIEMHVCWLRSFAKPKLLSKHKQAVLLLMCMPALRLGVAALAPAEVLFKANEQVLFVVEDVLHT